VNPLTTLASTLALPALLVTLGYAGVCYVSPFGPCRKCRTKAPGRARRYCHRCGGTRLRLRLGRRAWNLARRLLSEGTR
jgi:hypothetical protein